jgi:2-haloacid dehalogenase/putative hydrolase of the HAD superfamily
MPHEPREGRIDELVRRFDAVLLDFYGTVVHEDDAVVAEICGLISEASPGGPSPAEIAGFWWTTYSKLVLGSHGSVFESQRSLEHRSLLDTLTHFSAKCHAGDLSERMYAHWMRPPIFDDAQAFLDQVPLPVVVVSNIDRRDIEAAIAVHRLAFSAVVTSEDVRAYKPRPEPFRAAADAVGAPLDRVLHVGDSATSDVAGANALGISVAWVNRTGKRLAAALHVDCEVRSLTELIDAG